MAKNKVRIDGTGNPELAGFFDQKRAGDRISLTLEGRFTGTSAAGEYEMTLTRVTIPGAQKEEIKPDGEEPASVLIRAGQARPVMRPSDAENY